MVIFIVKFLNYHPLSVFINLRSFCKHSFTGVKSLTLHITKEPVFLSMNFPLISMHKKRRTLLAFKGYFWKEKKKKKKRLFFTDQSIADIVFETTINYFPARKHLFLVLPVLFFFFSYGKKINSSPAGSFHNVLSYPGIDHFKNNNYS